MAAVMHPAPSAGAARVALLGIPVEAGAGVPGALMGPAALRTAGLVARLSELGCAVDDHGDLAPPARGEADPLPGSRNSGEIQAWTHAIHNRAHALLGTGAVPIFLGGDHSLSMGTVSAVARFCRDKGRELAVLWLDAHADFNTPAISPSGNLHGMSLAFLTGEDSLRILLDDDRFVTVAPEALHLIGLRSIDAEERLALARHGIDCVDMRMIDEAGISVLIRRILEPLAARRAHIHVSLDIDFLEPSLAPGVGTTVPGGATYREAHLVMELLHDSGLVGSLDVVELNPFLDERGRSATLLTGLITSLFGRTILDRTHPRMANL